MAQPGLSQVHVVTALTQISIAYMQDQNNFIADKVFPIVPVLKQSDKYFSYTRDAFFRSDAEERADATETPGTGYNLDSSQFYNARVYGIHDDVSDAVRANSDSVLNPDMDATELVTQQLLIKRENTWITNYFGAGIWTTNLTGVAGTPSTNQFKQWDQAGSTPIEDVRTQALAIAALTGFKPNKLVLGPYVANQLINNPEIVDRIKYTQLGFVDYALLAQAFGVDEVLVPMATQNTATEGASLAMSFMYGKGALLVYANPTPGLRKPSGGYIFGWLTYLNATASIAISRFRMQHLKADRIEGEMAFDMKQTGADLGVYFASAVS